MFCDTGLNPLIKEAEEGGSQVKLCLDYKVGSKASLGSLMRLHLKI